MKVSGGLGFVGGWIGHKYYIILPLDVDRSKKPKSSDNNIEVGYYYWVRDELLIFLMRWGWILVSF